MSGTDDCVANAVALWLGDQAYFCLMFGIGDCVHAVVRRLCTLWLGDQAYFCLMFGIGDCVHIVHVLTLWLGDQA